MTSPFIVLGENLHCSRLVLLRGKSVEHSPGGPVALRYADETGNTRRLPIDPDWLANSPDAAAGRLKMVSLAIFSALQGRDEGADYLRRSAANQLRHGATFLDINVDEYAQEETVAQTAMKFLVELLRRHFPAVPLSVDSSRPALLAWAMETFPGDVPFILNSISPKNIDALPWQSLKNPRQVSLILSAAGRDNMPANVAARVENLLSLREKLNRLGFDDDRLHLDALVFPIAVEARSALDFLECTRQLRTLVPRGIASGGISNISYGLPCRRFLNNYFLVQAGAAGCGSGLIDPLTTPLTLLPEIERNPPLRECLKTLFDGEDPYGVDYLQFCKESGYV